MDHGLPDSIIISGLLLPYLHLLPRIATTSSPARLSTFPVLYSGTSDESSQNEDGFIPPPVLCLAVLLPSLHAI